jgi:hypothetical protein
MTARSRRHKLAKIAKRLAEKPEETFLFLHTNRNVEVVAHTLEEAQGKFMFTYGYFPEQIKQETE